MMIRMTLCDNSKDIQHSQCQLIAHQLNKNVAGVRDGAAGPRDQPSGSLQVRRPSKDRPQPVERRFFPLRSPLALPGIS